MAAWSLELESRQWLPGPLWGHISWTQPCRGVEGIPGRAPCRMAWRSQLLATMEAARCSTESAGNERELVPGTVSKLCQQGHVMEAVQALGVLVEAEWCISRSLFYTVLKRCVGKKDLILGRRVHAFIVKTGYESDTFLGNHILRMYASHGMWQEAVDVFSMVAEPDAFMWSSMISANVKQGRYTEAIHLYQEMRRSSVKPDGHVFVAALQACAKGSDLKAGQQVHADMLASGFQSDVFVGSCLVDMYAKCGGLEDARRVFEGLGEKDVVMWNAMIAGYSQKGMGQEALRLYSSMQEEGVTVPNSVTYISLLQACASVGSPALEKGMQLHTQIYERGHQANLFVASSLLNMYAKCGSLEDAQEVFDGIVRKDVVMWNTMIAGYSQKGMGQEALRLYIEMRADGMVEPNCGTFVSLLQACASLGTPALEKGKQLHAQIREQGHQADVFVSNSLVNMYAKCGSVKDAQRVFEGLGQKDVGTWNAMISGYAQQDMGHKALCLYSAMQEEGMAVPDAVTFVCLLQSCASVGSPALEMGKQLHAQIRELGHETDMFVASSLVNMYAKCGGLEDARRVFEGLEQKNVVTWNAMISGYAQLGMGQEALRLHSVMQEEGIAVPDPVTFVCLLQACASLGTQALEKGKQLHAEIRDRGHESDVFLASSLVNMYAKLGSLEEAQRVFEGLDRKDVVTWNAMISGYAKQGQGQQALSLYCDMEEGMPVPDSVTFVCLLQACANVGTLALDKGKQLHAQIRDRGHQADAFVASSLVNMYAKCGSLEDAQRMFDGLGEKDVVTWNSLIGGYSQQSMGQEALRLYKAMQEEGMAEPDPITFVCLLQACASVGNPALEQGKQLHTLISEEGHESDVNVANSLVNMYAKCDSLEDARRVFEGLGQKDVVTWNAMISGYSQHGMGHEALRLYSAMQEEGLTVPDSVTFVCLLQGCANLGHPGLEKGKQLHTAIAEQGLQADVFVASSLINMYAKCGSLEDAQRVFEGRCQTSVVIWNAMIAGYSRQGMGQEALRLFSAMEEEGISAPNEVTFVCLLQACARVGTPALEKGKQIHAQIIEQAYQSDVFIANSVVNMYAKCGSLEDAQSVFEGHGKKDVVTWNAMISGCVQQGMGQEALGLYSAMQENGMAVPDSLTFVSLLQACASVGTQALEKGKQLHVEIRERGYHTDVFVGNTLVDMYSKCGSLEDAQRVFEGLSEKGVVAWNALIAGYSQQGMGQEALYLYSAMQEDAIAVPDSATFVHLLKACANVAALHLGRHLHAQIEEQGLQADVVVTNSLINMYGKSGSMADAQQVFGALPERSVVAWNALIVGYSQQGDSDEVFDLVIRMGEDDIQPDAITLLGVLVACSHTGLLHKGQECLESMSTHYGITPSLEHYSCVVDLLGRAGRLDEALALVKTMPVAPDTVVWHTLLGACQKWSNLEVGRRVFDQALSLERKHPAAYALMSNIYNGAQMWEQALKMQERRVRMGAWKQPGQSWWTDMDGVVHSFLVGDNKNQARVNEHAFPE